MKIYSIAYIFEEVVWQKKVSSICIADIISTKASGTSNIHTNH